MNHSKTIKRLPFWQSPFFVKLLHWEYWPSFVVYAPAAFYWLYFAIRSRRLFYFTAVNPVIETGGVFGESKIDILNRIPKEVLPETIYVPKEEQNIRAILAASKVASIDFPFIAKPDIGERGFLVEIIKDEIALADYLEKINAPFIIQELIDYPVELSVLHYRMPNAKKGKVTSICIKKTLSVIGDGKSTIRELMQKKPRARLQLARFQQNYPSILDEIPNHKEEVELEPIGNHSRGTTFLNGNHLINHKIEKVFDDISFQMEDIFYGRFDLKCQSIELLEQGKGIKILEFNGVAGEPAHIYDPNYPVWKAYRDIYQHFKIVFQIARVQLKRGGEVMDLKEFLLAYKKYRKYLYTVKEVNEHMLLHSNSFQSDFWKNSGGGLGELTEELIAKAEKELKVKLPDVLIELLKIQNGGYTKEFVFPTKKKNSWSDNHVPFNELFGISFKNKIDEATIMDSHYLIKEWGLPKKQILLGGDGHWWITLDYRKNRVTPSVTWLDVEMGEDIKLANSFSEFIGGLVANDEFSYK